MPSDKDYIFDAITIFHDSNTGQGKAVYGDGGSSFVTRYQTLAAKSLATLKKFSTIIPTVTGTPPPMKIKFVALAPDTWGQTYKPDGPIELPSRIKMPTLLPVIASTLVHEAAHLNTAAEVGPNYVPDELACRTLECLFYQDLATTGVEIPSLVYGATHLFKMTDTAWKWGMKEQYMHFVKKQLIDFVLSMSEYRNHLQADWVETNLTYWGGPNNRWSTTLGYYVHRLAAHPTPPRNRLVQKLMKIASDRGSPAWVTMIKAAAVTPMAARQIKAALSSHDIFMSTKDNLTMKHRVNAWGLASQPVNGLNCLP